MGSSFIRKLDAVLLIMVILSTAMLCIALVGRYGGEGGLTTPTQSAVDAGAPTVVISPNVTRYVTVYRADGSTETYVKVGDPPTLQWYRLLANWMFAFYYRDNYQGQNLRQSFLTLDGASRSWFDNAHYGASPTPVAYFSNTTDVPNFTTYTVSPRYTGRSTWYDVTLMASDASDSSTYRARYVAVFTNIGSSSFTARIAFVAIRGEFSSDQTHEVIFLLDRIDPPVTLNTNEAINVTWVVEFPRQLPYTDHFWTVLRNFLGLTNGPPDFGVDYSSVTAYSDSLREDLRIRFLSGSSDLLTASFSAGTIQVVRIGNESDGFYIRLRAVYNPTSPATVDNIRVILVSDSNTGSSTTSAEYTLFQFPIGPVNVSPGRPLIVEVTIKFANLFT